ncbi:hypothetical protein AF72_01545 [Xylella taiwanensis]|uniref:Uncharacterized protein n=1 Tax=Xylella taiwanensis TaxID=1444770 RepID=Z9JMF3_9GAMM|nr:TorF family putative porin [Xylella taiwanensis]EWS79158.1 hypothetical protein AF72_01545 [Xylella taiwanensis]
MSRIPAEAAAIFLLANASPAFAQDSEKQNIAVSGSASIASDYRFRGVSQTNKAMTIQGGFTLSHKSGAYVGAWAANLAYWGTFGGANMELDLIAGYKLALAKKTMLDIGLTWYVYPGSANNTNFAESYVKLSGTTGPIALTTGFAYAPKQKALGHWYFTGTDAAAGVYNAPYDKQDNLYLWGDAAVALQGTPLTAKAHSGYSKGNPGLGQNATSIAPTGKYWDWSLGLDASWHNLTLGVSYVDTNISRSAAAYLQPSFSKGQDGIGSIADGAAVVSLTAAF